MPDQDGPRSPGKVESAEQRRARLAAELRANLQKRKAQARARAQQPQDSSSTE